MTELLPFDAAATRACFHLAFPDAGVAVEARKAIMLLVRAQAQPETDLFSVELVLTELIANVARHAPGPLEVVLGWTLTGARLEVMDSGPGYAIEAGLPDDPLSESHRGIFLIHAHASEVRVERRGGKNVTSVVLAMRPRLALRSPRRTVPARRRDVRSRTIERMLPLFN
jgi:anti-sigma regulatory factor (Ser/Thr protein kinase)